MSPQSHNRLYILASIIALFGGALLGFVIGTQFGGPIWRVGGLVVGIVVAEITARASIVHYVPVKCPECGARMKCRTRQTSDTLIAWYICHGCDYTSSPSLEYSKRLLTWFIYGLRGRNRK